MKMFKRFTALLIAVIFVVGVFVPTVLASDASSIDEIMLQTPKTDGKFFQEDSVAYETSPTTADVKEVYVENSIRDWAYDVVWKLLKRASSSIWLTHQPAVRSITPKRIELTTGGIAYNSGNIGGSSRIDVQANSSTLSVNMNITVTTTTNFINGLTQVIHVWLTHVATNTDVINRNLGYNSMAAYAISSSSRTGAYTARFTTTNAQSWNCGVIVVDNNAGGTGGPNVPEPYSLGNQYVTSETELCRYLIPSASHESRASLSIGSKMLSTKDMTVDMLYSQMYDEQNRDFVYSFKELSIGDTVYVRDTVSSLIYDKERDRTIFEFKTKYGNVTWPFDGDLTNKYHKGDELTFRFRIVEEYASDAQTFENTDYAKLAMQKLICDDSTLVSLDINDYLVDVSRANGRVNSICRNHVPA